MEEAQRILTEVQVSVPLTLLKGKLLRRVISLGINPEIGLDYTFYSDPKKRELEELARILRQNIRSVTLHAPFTDLAPGSPDPEIRSVSQRRLSQAFDLVEIFSPLAVVCHTGYSHRRYHENYGEWLEGSLETFSAIVQRGRELGTEVLFENVFEPDPGTLVELVEGLGGDNVGFCLDVGHARVFSRTGLLGWLKALAPRLKMVHLHDNDGVWDYHWGLGMGDIDFGAAFGFLRDNSLEPIITLEPHREDWLDASLVYLKELWPLFKGDGNKDVKRASHLHSVRPG